MAIDNSSERITDFFLDACENEPNDFNKFLGKQRRNNPKTVIVGSLNINSIRHKLEFVKSLSTNGYVDILALCETKLDNSLHDGQFHTPNFACIREDRTAFGEGLMIYVRSDIPHRRRYGLGRQIDCHIGFEVVILDVTLKPNDRWLHILGYKPPNILISNFADTFSLMCDIAIKVTPNVVILGDYNCDFLKSNALCEICDSFDIHNLISTATCLRVLKVRSLTYALSPNRFVLRMC